MTKDFTFIVNEAFQYLTKQVKISYFAKGSFKEPEKKRMERREFLKKTIIGGLGIGLASPLFNLNQLVAADTIADFPDLTAVVGGEPAPMFDAAMAAMGGMKRFVKKGQRVLVKPNIGWDIEPERAANSNPELVRRIVEHCIEAGAREVMVFDHTCDKWNRCYVNSGIEQAVKDGGGKMAPGHSESSYQEIEIPKGLRLKKAKIHSLVLESDVFINVPVLKSHGSAQLTIAMKNHMGIVWDRWYWHANDLHQCIADFATVVKPHLNIVDAYQVMMQNGPRGVSKADLKLAKYLVVSTDQVAADVASARIFGTDPAQIPYIQRAAALGAGEAVLDNLSIKRVRL